MSWPLNIPTAKDLDSCNRSGFQGAAWGGSAPSFSSAWLRGHIPPWLVFLVLKPQRRQHLTCPVQPGERDSYRSWGRGCRNAKESRREELGAGKGKSGDLPLVSFPGYPGLPFPLLVVPGWSAGDRDQEGDPCRLRQGRGNPGGNAPRPSSPLQGRRHLPEPPHWHRVAGLGRAGAAPGERRAATCGELGFSSGLVPRPAAPITASIHTHTFRPSTSATAVPCSGPSSPPALLNHSGHHSPLPRALT